MNQNTQEETNLMGKVGIALLFGVLGLLGGALLIGPLIGGAMMGAGAGSGLTLGTCSTVKAAQELGYLTPQQVDETLTRAAEDMGGQALAKDQQIVGSAAACDEALANILSEGEQ